MSPSNFNLPQAVQVAQTWCVKDAVDPKVARAVATLLAHAKNTRTTDLIDLSVESYHEAQQLIARVSRRSL
jgi:hypothetical protein